MLGFFYNLIYYMNIMLKYDFICFNKYMLIRKGMYFMKYSLMLVELISVFICLFGVGNKSV